MCNVEGKKTIHPCHSCLPNPICTQSSRWAPTYCAFCISSTVSALNNPKEPVCPEFYKGLRYWRKRAYSINPFAKDLDQVAFQCILQASTKHFPIHDQLLEWEKDFLLKVSNIALGSDAPYEVFKLSHASFLRNERSLDQEKITEQAASTAKSPPRPRSRSRVSPARKTHTITKQAAKRSNKTDSASREPQDLAMVPGKQPLGTGNTSSSHHLFPLSPSKRNAGAGPSHISSSSLITQKQDQVDILAAATKGLFEDSDSDEYVPHQVSNPHEEDDSDTSSNHSELNFDDRDDDHRSVAPDSEEDDGIFSPDEDDHNQNILVDGPLNLNMNQGVLSSPPRDNLTGQSTFQSYRADSPSPTATLPNPQTEGAADSSAPGASNDPLPEDVFRTRPKDFTPPSKFWVVNEDVGKVEYLTGNNAPGNKDGWFFVTAKFTFGSKFFTHRTMGEFTVISPTPKGSTYLPFIEIFKYLDEYKPSETEKTRRLREHVYNQVLALLHNDADGIYKTRTGWTKGPNIKQVLTSKIPPSAVDAVEKKSSPARRQVKPSLFFVATPGTSEEAFLRTINQKHTAKIDNEASMFNGEFWSPKREAEDSLEQARLRLQRVTNTIMGSQAISDIAEEACSSSSPSPDVLRDLLHRIKALSDENLRLLEPALTTTITEYSKRKSNVRHQMIKGLEPARLREPLLQAPIFSEDINIFPSATLKKTNELALQIEEKVTLPKDAYRRKPNIPTSKRSHSGNARDTYLPKKQKYHQDSSQVDSRYNKTPSKKIDPNSFRERRSENQRNKKSANYQHSKNKHPARNEHKTSAKSGTYKSSNKATSESRRGKQ